MIRLIRGVIVAVEEHAVVVDVHGIGYYIRTCVSHDLFTVGGEILFHTHLAVRENALDLYGFTDQDTLEVFELLITLPKIGPKTAQQFLRQADISLLKQAVRNNDAVYLSKLSGIGKKSAEKIVLGLRDQFEPDEYAVTETVDDSVPSYTRDTVDALIALGYTQDEARRAVRDIGSEHTDITTSAAALKLALKKLSN